MAGHDLTRLSRLALVSAAAAVPRAPASPIAGMLAGVEPPVSSPVLVGRSSQLAALETAQDEVGRGRPSAVMVGGEAGVGKSRLVTKFAAGSRATAHRLRLFDSLLPGSPARP